MRNKIVDESNLNIIKDITEKMIKDEDSFKIDENLKNSDLTNLDIIEKFCDSKLVK
ncbi:MAG: hypothetical protein Q4B33_00450 [Fusobacterium sp.]|nr:hypothetical protein [Fusobacterium sp.]